MMEKICNFQDIESKIAQVWDLVDAFQAHGINESQSPDDFFTIILPPPNVTGSLHMGHALNATLQDILVRFERMQGKNVLWLPGLDHAGIATQILVERHLLEKGTQRKNLTRQDFIDHVWRWKEEFGGKIFAQLKKLGASCDWSRERFTMDEGMSRAVIEVFVSFFKQGFIYRDKRLVNWDPVLLTAISDLEVDSKEAEGNLWFIKYPKEGIIFDPHNPETFVSVATTRPETIFGDSAVAVHPEDERYQNILGTFLILPFIERKILVVGDCSIDPKKGSGAMKVTPAHDFNDLEIGKRFSLPVINIFTEDARMHLVENDSFWIDLEKTTKRMEFVSSFEGLDRFIARKKLLLNLEEAGFLLKTEPHKHIVPHGDRSGVVLEPRLTQQWYLKVDELAKPSMEVVRNGDIRFVPDNWEKNYLDWMENIQPWCISRQLWWGHQIPAWYGPDGRIFVEHTEKEALDCAIAYYLEQEGPWSSWVREHIKHAPEKILIRDEDVLDTWFSSALWPFATLGFPEKTQDLKLRYPSNVLVTGFDIIFFWVARMIMTSLHFTGKKPFHTVYVHALVRDKHGAKMSKSKGNVVDPLDLIAEYGADALRFMLASHSAPGADIRLDESRMVASRNFGTKLWNATRFVVMNTTEMNNTGKKNLIDVSFANVKGVLNRWILTELSYAIHDTTKSLLDLRFHDAAAFIFRFVRNSFCDWYLEFLKPTFINEQDAVPDLQENKECVSFVLDSILKLLHPFMPFITEELWSSTGNTSSLLCHASWPEVFFEDIEAQKEINWLIDLISGIRSSRAEMRVPVSEVLPLFVSSAIDPLTKRYLEDHGLLLKRMARLSSIEFVDDFPVGSLQIIVKEVTFFLYVGDSINIEQEKSRILKDIQKIKIKMEQCSKKLSHEEFLQKASEEVIALERNKMDDCLQRVSHLEKALLRIKS